MAQDPVSAVASWLTPAAPGEVAEDPVIALIAEAARLDALSLAATNRGDQIFSTLPEDVRKGRMRVSFSKLGDVLQRHNGFTSEADLQEWVRVHRNWAMVLVRSDVKKGRISAEDLAAEEAEFDREIGLDQALAQTPRRPSGDQSYPRDFGVRGALSRSRGSRDAGGRGWRSDTQHKTGYARRGDCDARTGERGRLL